MSDELRVDDLLPSELEALEAQGRIKDGLVMPVVPVEAAKPGSALPASAIPERPTGVTERMAALKQVTSSFVATNEKGEVKKSEDGGKEVEESIKAINPDWATATPEDPIEAADKAGYLSHILGAPFFEKSYPLFGGAITVTFRTLKQDKIEQCIRQAWNDDVIDGALGKPGTQDADSGRIGRFQTYKFVGELATVKRPGGLVMPYAPFEAADNLKENVWPIRTAWLALQKEMSAPLLIALRQAHKKFELLVARMTIAADKPDFWIADSGT